MRPPFFVYEVIINPPNSDELHRKLQFEVLYKNNTFNISYTQYSKKLNIMSISWNVVAPFDEVSKDFVPYNSFISDKQWNSFINRCKKYNDKLISLI